MAKARKPATKKAATKKPATKQAKKAKKAKKSAAKPKATIDAKQAPPWKAQPEAAAFFTGELPKLVGASPARTSAKLAELEASLGAPLTDELRKFLVMTDGVAHDFGEWRIDGHDMIVTNGDSNRFEQLLALDQQNYLGTALVEWMTGSVWVGSAGNGDSYLACPNALDATRCPVWLFDHETFDFAMAVADSLSSLAWLNKLYTDVHDDGTDTAAIARGMAKIEDRVNPSWHYSKVVEVSERSPKFEADIIPKYYFYRSAWIIYLLRNDGVTTIDQIPKLFGLIDHGKLDVKKSIADGYVTTYPVTAIYWLWRTWFFGHDDDLQKVLAATDATTSPMIRDTAALVRELVAGRKQVGTIADIQALRAEFQALDLDPARAGARKQEQVAKKKVDSAQKKLDRQTARELIAAGGDLVAVAWGRLDRPTIVDEIYKHLREDASFADDFVRYDFLIEERFSRGGMLFNREADDVVEALGATGQRLFPLLAADLTSRWSLPILAHGGDARLVPRLKRLLSIREKYNHTLTGAVAALAAVGAKEIAGTLTNFLREFNLDGFANEIANKDLLVATIDALARFREPTSVPALLALARNRSDDYKAVVPKAIKALGRIGDRRATPVLIDALGGPYRDVATYALARLGDPASRDAVLDLIDRLVGHPTQTIYLRTMGAALRSTLGESPDLAIALAALNVVMDNKFAAVELHETAIELVARHASDVEAVRVLLPFVDAEQQAVRRAAWIGLAKHGSIVTPTWLDRGYVDKLFTDGGAKALDRALRDPHGVFEHNVLRKAADTKSGPAVAEAAVAVARNITRFDHYTNGYVRDDYDSIKDTVEAVMKLATDATDDLVETWLDHPNVLVREALDDHFAGASKRIQKLADDPRRANPRKPGDDAKEPVALDAQAFGAAPFRFGKRINGLAWEPGGSRLAVVGDSKGAIYDTAGREVLRLDEVRGYAYDVDWHPDGKSLAICFHAGHLLRLDATTGAIVTRYAGHGGVPDGVRRVRFSADGKRLASVSDDESFRLWDTESGKQLAKHEDKFDCNGVTFFPDGKHIAIGTDKAVHLFDGKGKHLAKSDVGGLADLVVLPGATTFAAGGSKAGILILDLALKKKGVLKQEAIARLQLSPDGTQLVAASWEGKDNGVSVWDLAKAKRKRLVGHDDQPVWALRIDPATGTIAAGGDKGSVVRWRADGTLVGSETIAHGGEVGGLAIDHVTETLYSCADSLIAWRLGSREPVRVFPRKHDYSLNSVALSADGHVVYATGMDGCGAWNVETGAPLWHVKLGRSERVVVLDPTTLVAGDGDRLAWLDAATGAIKQKSTSCGHTTHRLAQIAGDRLVTCEFLGDHSIDVWDARTGERLPDVPLVIDDTHGVYDLAISGDGTRAYVTCADKTIKVLDTGSWKLLKEYRGAETRDRVAISPSKRLLAASADPELALFDATTFEVLGEVKLDADVETMTFVDDTTVVCGLEDGGVVRVKW